MFDSIIAIIGNVTGVDVSDLNSDTLLETELGVTSFEMIRLVYDLEQHFDIVIPKNVYHCFVTVGDILQYIEKTVN